MANYAPPPAAAAPQPTQGGTPTIRVEAALGTNSPTNFYKGLSGNDIIQHGGIFVASFKQIPKKGTTVALNIKMPGGYEFNSIAVVVWTREQGGGESSPGFGARFIEISPEGRQLVYRYVRNREPLFYDDL